MKKISRIMTTVLFILESSNFFSPKNNFISAGAAVCHPALRRGKRHQRTKKK